MNPDLARGGPQAANLSQSICLQPLLDQIEDLLSAQIVERLVIAAWQEVQLALFRRSSMQLFAAGRVDKAISGAGEDQEGNRNLAGPRQHISSRLLPLSEQAARYLRMHKRIGPVSRDDLRHSRQSAGIHLIAHCEPGHQPRGRLSEVDLPLRYYHFRLPRRTRDDKAPGIGKVPGKDGAQEGGSAERVTDGDELLTRCRRDGLPKRGDV